MNFFKKISEGQEIRFLAVLGRKRIERKVDDEAKRTGILL